MSTTTLPPSVLADYALHHSASTNESTGPVPRSQSNSQIESISQSNPPSWPTNYRRVPPYRPINRTLDFAERSAGASVPEYIFIQSMLHGVWLNAALAVHGGADQR